VGDGLEVFIILAKGKTLEGLEGVAGIEEVTTQPEGELERTFIVRRELKKD
jgi:20S proteasome subunit beta 6